MVTSRYRPPVPPLPDPSALPYPANVVRLCYACDLRKSCKAPVAGLGPAPSRVLLLGEAPGSVEDEYGKPFVGPSGRQLDSLLFLCGLTRESVYITNALKCRPPNNATPKPVQVRACAKWLDIELELVNPRIVVAMGASAIRRVLGDDAGTVEHLHGKPVAVKVGSAIRVVLPCYHPAAALHDTSKLRQLNDDFRVLRGLLTDHDLSDYNVQDEYPNPVYRVVDTPALMKWMLDEVREVGECAVDVETVNRGTELWSIQVSAVLGTAWFVPMKKGYTGRVDLKGWGARIIVHHYLNDIRWLDIQDGNFTDSMVQSYLVGQPQGLKELASRLCGIKMVSYGEQVQPWQRGMSIAYLTEAAKREWADPPEIIESRWDNKAGKVVTKAKKPWHISRKIRKLLADCVDDTSTDAMRRWTDIPASERVEVEKTLGLMPEASLADIPFERAMEYSCRDAMATLRVKHKLDKLIADLGLSFVLKMDLDILPMVDEMMRNGMAVDLDQFRRLSAEYTTRMAAKASEMAKLVGHPFNPNSSDQVAAVVYGEMGFKPTAFTPSREISTDDQELKKVKHPVAKGIIEYRRISKMKGTYADALVEWAVPDAQGIPRVHTTLKTTRVETGRLSSADPNLQNIPTRNKEARAIKSGFVAPPGKRLFETDYAQIEMCTLAHLSKCWNLIELFNRGGDPHTEMAARVFDVPLEDAKQEKYRYPVKRLNFGVAYLIGAKGLSNQINEYIADLEMEGEKVEIEPWDEPACERFLSDWYKINPEVKDFQMEMAAMARRRGYVSDIFNRIRFIPEVSSPIKSVQEAGARQAANMPVTSSAQEIIKAAMGRLWRELPRTEWREHVRWDMQIHDSLLTEVTDDERVWRPFLMWMREVMTSVVRLRVPVKVDFKTGVRWGELEKVKL